MTKFQKTQRILSVIPVLSTIFIIIVTMIDLRRKKAGAKWWLLFFAVFFGCGIISFFINMVVMTGKHPILNILITGIILGGANSLFVRLQIKSSATAQKTYHQINPKYIVAIVGVLLLVFICTTIVLIILSMRSSFVDIEDINGTDNTQIESINLLDIIQKEEYSAFNTTYSQEGNQTEVGREYREYDYSMCNFEIEKISGIMTIMATQTREDSITIDISSEVERGNMEIFIIVDGSYYNRIPANKAITIHMEDISGKLILIKMAAESAMVNVDVKRSIDSSGDIN